MISNYRGDYFLAKNWNSLVKSSRLGDIFHCVWCVSLFTKKIKFGKFASVSCTWSIWENVTQPNRNHLANWTDKNRVGTMPILEHLRSYIYLLILLKCAQISRGFSFFLTRFLKIVMFCIFVETHCTLFFIITISTNV